MKTMDMRKQISGVYSPDKEIMLNTKGVYKNKTLRYIVPILKQYGTEFAKKLNRVPVRGFTIGDMIFSDSLNDFIFMVVSTVNLNYFNDLLQYLEKQPYYISDYILSIKENTHVIVFKNPMPEIIDPFLKGDYSKMYTQEEIERFFIKLVKIKNIEYYTDVYSILTKREEYKTKFEEILGLDFNTSITLDDNREFDYPPLLAEEVLNTKENNSLDLILQQQNMIENVELWK